MCGRELLCCSITDVFYDDRLELGWLEDLGLENNQVNLVGAKSLSKI